MLRLLKRKLHFLVMAQEIETKKGRSMPWLLGGLALVSLTVLVLLQSSNLWKSLSVETASDTLLLYGLSTLNFIAFVIFAFIFLRNLFKLLRERRALQLGAKIRTKLWLYFIAVSFLPVVAMAGFSYLFMNRALERWFTQIPETAVRAAKATQERALLDRQKNLAATADILAKTLSAGDMSDKKLLEVIDRGGFTAIGVLGGEEFRHVERVEAVAPDLREQFWQALESIKNKKQDSAGLSDGIGFDAVFADLGSGRRLFLVTDFAEENASDQLAQRSLNEFDRLKNEQQTVRQIGFSTLALLTFLLIFAASWTAFYVARGITQPIKALAEGSREVAVGNFAHRVNVPAEDELDLLVNAFNDMTGRLEVSSTQLREGREYIETVLQSLNTGVISFDAENRVTTINKSATDMLRLEAGQFVGFTLENLVGEENRAVLEKLFARAKRIGFATEQTVLLREDVESSGENGSVPVALTATALPARRDGRAGGMVLVIEDLTELISAQRASAWQEVARRMAHEIKNPLTPIQLSAERIAKRFAAAEKNGELTGVISESTETILREVDSLKSMVDEFSRFARLPNVKLEAGDIAEVIGQSLAGYEDREGVKIETEFSANLPSVMIDSEQMRRVFVNLIENAIEAFDRDQPDKQIRLTARFEPARDLVVAEVSDNGNGIAPQNLQRLFQPYFSTKGRGTGLGLAIVQRIIAEHHGKIRAAANQPKGAKFIVELPANV